MKIIIGIQNNGHSEAVQALSIKEFLDEREVDYKIPLVFAPDKKNGIFPDFCRAFPVYKYKGVFRAFFYLIKQIRREKPDIILNFYNPLLGLSSLFFPNIKYINISHHYHYEFTYRRKFLNWITSLRGQRVAITTERYVDENDIIYCPPILRRDFYKKETSKEKLVLIYLKNKNQFKFLLKDCKRHPRIKFKCFTKNWKFFKYKHNYKNLEVFPVGGKNFKKFLFICDTVVCEGGFETSAEAIFLGKKLLITFPYYQNEDFLILNANNIGISGRVNISKAKLASCDTEWFREVDLILLKIFFGSKCKAPFIS